MYLIIKNIHILCVIVTFALFLIRGIWMIQESDMLKQKWVRITPHVVDTFLLLSAIILMVMSSQYPFAQGWLTAKLIALIVYIGLGVMAFRVAQKKIIKIGFWIDALLVFGYMVLVAYTRQAWPF
ncbi:MAG: SirB2 family protein [Pseudomonadota bacterium]